MTPSRPRVLILGGNSSREHPVAQLLGQYFEVDQFERMDQAMEALRSESYHAVFADAGDFLPLERALVGEKASLVLNTIGEGVCIVDSDGRCSWTNEKMRGFSVEAAEQTKRICRQALSLFATQRGGITRTSEPPGNRDTSGGSGGAGGGGGGRRVRSKKFAFQVRDHYFEMICSPVVGEHNQVQQVVAVVWDATSGKRLQAKIDAIDASGRELARIDNDAVAKLTPSERLRLLQDKIIRYSKELMHFDHFAIRLLDKRTNKLEVVIAEGLPPNALEIDLYAQPEGNGISGYVAATGRSYICHDTEKDPRYVLGLRHSKSTLTVPLMLFDEVVGVYNIESDQVGAFSEDDRQFAEIFGRYVALALNILDLLVVERYTTSGQISDSVVQEVAQPLNDIQTEAQSLMEEYIGDDAMREKLNRISDHVETIRHAMKDVAAGPKTVLRCEDIKSGESDPLLAGKRILIADDEPNIRKTIADVLTRRGSIVHVCKDGYEACSLLEQESFDLVLSDIRMPYRNGYEIFAAAQRIHEGTPVVLMTGFGYDPHHSIVRASQEGLSSVLFKPFKVDQLLEELHKAVAPRAPHEEKPADAEEKK